MKHNKMNKDFPCPCCGFLTFPEEPPGTFEICSVCVWQDDPVQFKNIDYEGGANEVSLRQARNNFREFGASSKSLLNMARKPLPNEIP